MHRHLERLGPPVFDEADRAFAEKIQATLTDEDIATSYARFGLKPRKGEALSDDDLPARERRRDPGRLDRRRHRELGGADRADARRVYAVGTPGHSWQLVAQGKAPAAHKGMEHAAKVMAATALDVIRDQELVAAAKADHRARLAGTPFVNPLPPDVEPPVKKGP